MDFDAFKEQVTVQEPEAKVAQAAAIAAAQATPQVTLPVPQQSGYLLSSMINGFGDSSSNLVTYGGGGTYLNNRNTSSTVKPRDYMTSYSSTASNSTESFRNHTE